jgi:hypothetical protein
MDDEATASASRRGAPPASPVGCGGELEEAELRSDAWGGRPPWDLDVATAPIAG